MKGSSCLLLLLGIVVAAVPDLLNPDRIPGYRDLLIFVIPFKHFLSDHLRHGQIPLWNPWVYLGTPFLASLQSGVFYPPSLLLFLPFPLGFNLFLLSHFFLALVGFWLVLRHRGLSLAAAAVGALTYTLGGFLVSMVSVTNNLQACAWAPWVLLLWWRYVEKPSRARIVLTGGAIGVQLLGGSPEVLLMTLSVAAAWTAWSTLPRWRDCFRLQTALFVAMAIAAGLTAFQIVPTVEYIGQSARSAALPFDEVSIWSLQPISLLQLVFPYSVSLAGEGINADRLLLEPVPTWIQSFYLGLVPLCLAVSALTVARERSFWGWTMLIAVVMALGAHTPLFPLLYRTIPWVIGKFRYPEKFYFLVHLSAPILAAEGLDACFRGEKRAQRVACVAAATLIAVAAALLVTRWSWAEGYLQFVARLSGRYRPMTEYVPLALNLSFKAQRVMLILGCFLAVLIFQRMAVLGPSTATVLLAALVATDLASTNYGLSWGVSWSALQAERPLVDVAEIKRTRQRIFLYQTVSDPPPGEPPKPIEGLEHWSRPPPDTQRFEAASKRLWRLLFIDIPMVHGVGTLSGGDGITRSSDNTLRLAISVVPRDRAVKLLKIFGAAYFVGPVPLTSSDLERVEDPRSAPFFVYRVKEPPPAAYLASRLLAAPTDVDAFNRMIAPGFRPGTDATVEMIPPGWHDVGDTEKAGSVTTLAWEDERVDLEVRSERQALLIVNSSVYPGWEARVDGVSAPIVRANSLVQGVLVGPGDHRVELRYRPRSLRVGAAISFATLAGLIALLSIRPRASAARLLFESS